MSQILVPIEWVLGVAALIVLLIVIATVARRRTIARGSVLTVCGYRSAGSEGWDIGFARVGEGRLEWYPIGGVSVRPRFVWDRHELGFGAPRPLPQPPRTIPEARLVECHCRGLRFELALPPSAVTAIRSWLESAPPGYNVNVA